MVFNQNRIQHAWNDLESHVIFPHRLTLGKLARRHKSISSSTYISLPHTDFNIRNIFKEQAEGCVLFWFAVSFISLRKSVFLLDAITVHYLLHETLLSVKGGSLWYRQMLTFTTFACSYWLFLSPENFTRRTPVPARFQVLQRIGVRLLHPTITRHIH